MANFNLRPTDDPEIPCKVRLWKGESVHVFVHPREWKRVSITGGTPMLITCCGHSFPCRIANAGEHFRIGSPKNIKPSYFGVPTHADYPAAAQIDWSAAVPELLKEGLERSPELLAAWLALSSQEMRARLSSVFRGRSPGVIAERQLQVLRALK